MAGVIINLSGAEARERYSVHGAYSYRQPRPRPGRGGWGRNQECVIADYLALTAGDLVFFFENRGIFGTGRIVRLAHAQRAAVCNYASSWDLTATAAGPYLWDNEPTDDITDHPFVVFFEPEPEWYSRGVDMDEALASDAHGYIKQLPFFSGVSFARIDDFEAAHLASLIRKVNRGADALESQHYLVHGRAAEMLSRRETHYDLNLDALIRQYSDDGLLRHEALLEAWLIDAFCNRWELVQPCLDRAKPAFVGRQLPASPFKPPQWVDRIDLLAYDIDRPTPHSRIPVAHTYLLAEVKRGEATVGDIRQTLKYVDWIAHREQGGDYEGITALAIAATYPAAVREAAISEGRRHYVRPRRPYDTALWDSFSLLTYAVQATGPAITLQRETEGI